MYQGPTVIVTFPNERSPLGEFTEDVQHGRYVGKYPAAFAAATVVGLYDNQRETESQYVDYDGRFGFTQTIDRGETPSLILFGRTTPMVENETVCFTNGDAISKVFVPEQGAIVIAVDYAVFQERLAGISAEGNAVD